MTAHTTAALGCFVVVAKYPVAIPGAPYIAAEKQGNAECIYADEF